MYKTKKEVRDLSGLFTAFFLCMIISIPLLCSGNGLTQGFSTFEKLRFIIVNVLTAGTGYLVGYFTLIHKLFVSQKRWKELN